MDKNPLVKNLKLFLTKVQFLFYFCAMVFQTRVDIGNLDLSIDYRSRGFAIGSCFAQELGMVLQRRRFNLFCNPLGVMFNPASVAKTLDRLVEKRAFTEDDLSSNGDLYCCFDASGEFSSSDKAEALVALNGALDRGYAALSNCDYVVITLGTSWIYERNGEIVANCHKYPSSEFVRRRLSVEQIVSLFKPLLRGALAKKRVILSVSPIRHIKDGLVENSLSKATLLVAVANLAEDFDNVSYFGSYEILVDELRDYRFYAEDMCHPSPLAVKIVVDRFCQSTMDADTLQVADKVESLIRMREHKVLNPRSEAHKTFRVEALRRVTDFVNNHPYIDMSEVVNYFEDE